MHYSKHSLSLWFLRNQESQTYNTAKETFIAQDKAQEFLSSILNPTKIKLSILAKHGFSKDQWAEVMERATHFWFSPDSKEEICNQEIKTALYHLPIINDPYYSYEMFTGNLCSQVKNYKIEQFRESKPFLYTLTDERYLEIDNYIKSFLPFYKN